MGWIIVRGTGLAGGDKFVLPFHGKMLTLIVCALIESEDSAQVSFGVEDGFLLDVFPERKLDLDDLPQGWRVIHAEGEAHEVPAPSVPAAREAPQAKPARRR